MASEFKAKTLLPRFIASPEHRSVGPNCSEVAEDHENKHNRRHLLASYFFLNIWKVKSSLGWIPENCTMSHLKPVIRSSVVAWVSLLFILIPRVDSILGQSSFLLLMSAFISPPSEPLIAVVEKEVISAFAVTLSWAWSCLGIKLANLARETFNPDATRVQIFSAQYIETAPTVILAVFLFLGTAFILFIRAWLGPGPFVPATFFACLCVDVSLTIAPLYPYPNYLIGRLVVVPVTIHAGLSILASLLIFPESVNAQFMKRFQKVLEPLAAGIKQQHELLQMSPLSDHFDPSPFVVEIKKSESACDPVAASVRLLKRDISWGRFNGSDLQRLWNFGRKLTMSAAGMAYFYRIMDTQRQKFPETPLPSQPATPIETPRHSRSATPDISEDEGGTSGDRSRPRGDRSSWHGSVSSSHTMRRHLHNLLSHLPQHHHHLLHETLIHLQEQHPVGVFESQQYMNIEKRRHHPHGEILEENSLRLLSESAAELLIETSAAITYVLDWLDRMNAERLRFWGKPKLPWKESIVANEKALNRLTTALGRFYAEKRKVLGILDPLKRSRDLPPHRYLFRAFLYQYHLLRFSEGVKEILQEIGRLDKDRRHSRLWPPMLPLHRIFNWSMWEADESSERAEEEDPDVIPGVSVKSHDLGAAEPRDADALPPTNIVELVGARIYTILSRFGEGNAQFALKTGILSVLLSLPSYMKDTATFAYMNTSVWALFIAQLTLARYRGDTIFGFMSRIVSTFFGALVGLVFWYSSSGNGAGNPYGLAVVGAVGLPILTFAMIHFPWAPTTGILFATTVVLTVGYSWQDTHAPAPLRQGYGWSVAWRRFLLVVIGVTAASIVSFLPPSKTIRCYHRIALSTTASEIGFLYCAIVSYAHRHHEEDGMKIIHNLHALRSKLKRMRARTINVQYEVSLRGKWPTDRYSTILNLQLELAYLLTHLMSVVDNLDPTWSRAFLQRTRFLDANFLGDILAVIDMISTSLRTATPLPQITPAPLFDRFLKYSYGLDVLQQDAAEDYGLPRTVTFETLQNEQYRCFSVGISCASGIMTRLDLLMHATKELVGEKFHVEGIVLPVRSHGGTREDVDGKITRFDAVDDGMKAGKSV